VKQAVANASTTSVTTSHPGRSRNLNRTVPRYAAPLDSRR
jgi:hypothetical protein